MKYNKNMEKKIGKFFLVMMLLITIMPTFEGKVRAEELPTNTLFATVDELKSFNTNDTDGTINPAKVYFGS